MDTSSIDGNRVLRTALWLVQILLASAFALTGMMKLSTPLPELAKALPWVTPTTEALARFVGACELAGAVGLILPAATRRNPSLTPLAAAGLLLVMILASGFHLSRGEPQALPLTLTLGGLAAFVAWGRTWKAPIPPR